MSAAASPARAPFSAARRSSRAPADSGASARNATPSTNTASAFCAAFDEHGTPLGKCARPLACAARSASSRRSRSSTPRTRHSTTQSTSLSSSANSHPSVFSKSEDSFSKISFLRLACVERTNESAAYPPMSAPGAPRPTAPRPAPIHFTALPIWSLRFTPYLDHVAKCSQLFPTTWYLPKRVSYSFCVPRETSTRRKICSGRRGVWRASYSRFPS